MDPAVLLTVADRMSEFEQHMEQTLAQLAAVEHQLGTAWGWLGRAGASPGPAAVDRWRCRDAPGPR